MIDTAVLPFGRFFTMFFSGCWIKSYPTTYLLRIGHLATAAPLCCRALVAMSNGEQHVRRVDKHGNFSCPPHQTTQTLRILIEQCWAPIPVTRPTFEEILEFLETIARDEVCYCRGVKSVGSHKVAAEYDAYRWRDGHGTHRCGSGFVCRLRAFPRRLPRPPTVV